MKKTDFIKKLYSLDKAYFSLPDLEKLLDIKRSSLRVKISRLVKEGILERLKKGVYQLSLRPESLIRVANQLYYPSYISFEYALGEYGILSEKPFTLTFATSKRTKKMILRTTEIEFRQIKQELFFGFKKKKGVFWGEPEKALLDQVYFAALGKADISLEQLTLIGLSEKKLLNFAKKYPKVVQKRVKEKLLPLLDQTPAGVK